MTYQLSAAQSELYEEGGFIARRIEDDVVEWAIDHNVHEPLVVTLDDGRILFAIYEGGLA